MMASVGGQGGRTTAALDDGAAVALAADMPLIDPQSIERLRELDPGGQQGVVDRVLRAYESSLRRHLADIRAAHEAADVDRLARAAHTLKSSSAAVGALGFSTRCAEVELTVRADKAVPSPAMVEGLLHEGQRVLVAIGAMLAP